MENKPKETWQEMLARVIEDWIAPMFVGLIICAIVSLFFSSCKTKQEIVEVEKVVIRTDTLLQTAYSRDSIYLHDSIYISERQKGDTIYLTSERWHTQYQDRWHNDTTYISHTDSVKVPTPYEVEKVVEVEKQLTTIQSWALNIGYAILVLLIMAALGALVYAAVNLKSKIKL